MAMFPMYQYKKLPVSGGGDEKRMSQRACKSRQPPPEKKAPSVSTHRVCSSCHSLSSTLSVSKVQWRS